MSVLGPRPVSHRWSLSTFDLRAWDPRGRPGISVDEFAVLVEAMAPDKLASSTAVEFHQAAQLTKGL